MQYTNFLKRTAIVSFFIGVQDEVLQLVFLSQAIFFKIGFPEQIPASQQDTSGNKTGAGIPVAGLVATVEPIDGAEYDNATGSDHCAGAKQHITGTGTGALDGCDFFIMERLAPDKNAVMPHTRNRAIEPLVIDGLHGELIPDSVGADVISPFLQDEYIGLRLYKERNEEKTEQEGSLHNISTQTYAGECQ